jgi:hypothetical protein
LRFRRLFPDQKSPQKKLRLGACAFGGYFLILFCDRFLTNTCMDAPEGGDDGEKSDINVAHGMSREGEMMVRI